LQGDNRWDIEAARKNGGMRSGAADIGDKGSELMLFELDGIRRRKVMRYENDRTFFFPDCYLAGVA
jgi:hypothetical protein